MHFTSICFIQKKEESKTSLLSFVNILWYCNSVFAMMSLKIPKGQSQSVYRRRTDNTLAKRISTKGQTTIYKAYIYKAKDRVTRNPLNTGGELMCSRKVDSPCFTSGTRRVNIWEIQIAMIAWIFNLVRHVPRIAFNSQRS